MKECKKCDGTGAIECDECLGSGQHECNFGYDHDCTNCDGNGKIECSNCWGEGEIEDEPDPDEAYDRMKEDEAMK